MTELLYADEEIIAFRDRAPAAAKHLLARAPSPPPLSLAAYHAWLCCLFRTELRRDCFRILCRTAEQASNAEEHQYLIAVWVALPLLPPGSPFFDGRCVLHMRLVFFTCAGSESTWQCQESSIPGVQGRRGRGLWSLPPVAQCPGPPQNPHAALPPMPSLPAQICPRAHIPSVLSLRPGEEDARLAERLLAIGTDLLDAAAPGALRPPASMLQHVRIRSTASASVRRPSVLQYVRIRSTAFVSGRRPSMLLNNRAVGEHSPTDGSSRLLNNRACCRAQVPRRSSGTTSHRTTAWTTCTCTPLRSRFALGARPDHPPEPRSFPRAQLGAGRAGGSFLTEGFGFWVKALGFWLDVVGFAGQSAPVRGAALCINQIESR